MGCLCGGGTTKTGGTNSESGSTSGTTSNTSTGSSRPSLPPELIEALKGYGINIGDTGMNDTQASALTGIQNNGAGLTAAGSAAATTGAGATSTANSALDYLKSQQNNGSFTLGKYFGAAPTISAAQASDPNAVIAGRGADYAGSYATPLNDSYVNASLNDYDTGVDRGFNALRAGNASAFSNKRTGVAEGVFQSDAARGRGNLSAGLNLNAFNTAVGQGQTDAERAFNASTTNAANGLSNSQFNANLAQSANMFNSNLVDSRQKFDIGGAQTGEASRLNTANNIINGASNLSGINSSNVNNASTVNSGNLQNLLAQAGIGNVSSDQLARLAQLWGVGVGGDVTSTSNGTTNGSFSGNSQTTGTSTKPGDPIGTASKIAMMFA